MTIFTYERLFDNSRYCRNAYHVDKHLRYFRHFEIPIQQETTKMDVDQCGIVLASFWVFNLFFGW